MLEAILWGVIQGLTEFLPISSSGHLVLVPELLGVEPPDLAITAVLHIGTLAAVVAYYRRDLARLVVFWRDPSARAILLLLLIGTLPAIAVLALEGTVEAAQASATVVAILLAINGVVLFASGYLRGGTRRLEDGKTVDAFVVGLAQIAAVFPGISRSGVTITAGQARRLEGKQAARFSFLLSIPVIAAAGLVEGLELRDEGGLTAEVWLGVAVAALVGYAAIVLVLRIVNRYGLRPFSYYCFALAAVSVVAL